MSREATSRVHAMSVQGATALKRAKSAAARRVVGPKRVAIITLSNRVGSRIAGRALALAGALLLNACGSDDPAPPVMEEAPLPLRRPAVLMAVAYIELMLAYAPFRSPHVN